MQTYLSDEERKLKIKKIAFCVFCSVLVPLAFTFTVFWCITAPFREVIAYPFACSFEDFKTEYGLARFYDCLRQASMMCFLQLILLPIQLISFCVCLLPLLCLWIKSAVVALWKLADYIFSKANKILVSNRLNMMTPSLIRKYEKHEEGSEVKTGFGAMLGYMAGIYNFDVELYTNYTENSATETIFEGLANVDSNTNIREIPILTRKRALGCKWY